MNGSSLSADLRGSIGISAVLSFDLRDGFLIGSGELIPKGNIDGGQHE